MALLREDRPGEAFAAGPRMGRIHHHHGFVAVDDERVQVVERVEPFHESDLSGAAVDRSRTPGEFTTSTCGRAVEPCARNAVATGSVVFLIGLVLLLFVGTGAVVKMTLDMTAQTEHADPRTAAELEEEGVDDPDAVLTDLVEGMARGRPEGEGR